MVLAALCQGGRQLLARVLILIDSLDESIRWIVLLERHFQRDGSVVQGRQCCYGGNEAGSERCYVSRWCERSGQHGARRTSPTDAGCGGGGRGRTHSTERDQGLRRLQRGQHYGRRTDKLGGRTRRVREQGARISRPAGDEVSGAGRESRDRNTEVDRVAARVSGRVRERILPGDSIVQSLQLSLESA